MRGSVLVSAGRQTIKLRHGGMPARSFWRAKAPDGIVVAVKGTRDVTDRNLLAQKGPSIEDTMP